MGPFSTKKAGEFYVDLEKDDAVRGALVLHNGELTWPPPPPLQACPDSLRSLAASTSLA